MPKQKKKRPPRGSNPRPLDQKSSALPLSQAGYLSIMLTKVYIKGCINQLSGSQITDVRRVGKAAFKV
ncbi:hypothetical protein FGO68_gene14204 [Halteria grandinella]|uniref:Uncharacterized protein n=1 Tax=Halteria grandinella TaxID=5974 RepID=A0A8J8SVV6_HALGN|nr:hypothetical protein FGO68_gene14204 [Halteria grandinella]